MTVKPNPDFLAVVQAFERGLTPSEIQRGLRLSRGAVNGALYRYRAAGRVVYVAGRDGEGILWRTTRNGAVAAARTALNNEAAPGDHKWTLAEATELVWPVAVADLANWRFE